LASGLHPSNGDVAPSVVKEKREEFCKAMKYESKRTVMDIIKDTGPLGIMVIAAFILVVLGLILLVTFTHLFR
jgi:hypothetical protein